MGSDCGRCYTDMIVSKKHATSSDLFIAIIK